MIFRCVRPLILLTIIGCSGAKVPPEMDLAKRGSAGTLNASDMAKTKANESKSGTTKSDPWVDVDPPEPVSEDADAFLQAGLEKLEVITNVYPRKENGKGPSESPRMKQTESEIELRDLGLVMRPVQLAPPRDGISVVFISDTEITNRMYADWLNETGHYRDDSDIQKAAAGEFTTYRYKQGIRSTSSTGSPIFHVRDASTLWKNGKYPEQRGDHPVACVTMPQATEFCKWIGDRYSLKGSVRLPTEGEWLFAAYGRDRKYPWGDDVKTWTSDSTQPVRTRPDLKTPEGLFGMWGNVSELVLSPSSGYGGEIEDKLSPIITVWLGTSYQDEKIAGHLAEPRQNYWGYSHSIRSCSDEWGFRIVFIPQQ